PEGHVPGRRARGRLLPRPECFRRRHQHRGHDERPRQVPQRRESDLLLDGLRPLGGLPCQLQRHWRQARGGGCREQLRQLWW
ncbi:hypothetical protein BN1723_020784, partial [Verticillium longisporum]